MITLETAEKIIEQNSPGTQENEVVELNHSIGRVLAEDIYSDIDMPPFNKSAMDGFACRREDISQALEVIETIPAGTSPVNSIEKGQCARIMTGAKIPAGADCVIKVEDTSPVDGNKIIFTAKETSDNLCFQGEDLKKGELVLLRGTIINPRITGLLASVGLTKFRVYRKIQIGFFCTGSELIEPDEKPTGVLIRNSNASQLNAQISSCGALPCYHGIIADTRSLIVDKLNHLADNYSISIITGGASMGDFDFIPGVLKQSGYTIHFRKVGIQPGKPVIYATKNNKHVFGLSGNPVSSFLQFELFVKTLIYKITGTNYQNKMIQIVTGEPISRKNTARRLFVPVAINHEGHIIKTEFHGSAHIGGLKDIFGFAIVPEGVSEIKKGEMVYVRPI